MSPNCKLRISLICLLTFIAVVDSADAQVAIGIKCDRHRYIAYEKIVMTMTIRNDSGNTLDFADSGMLRINVVDGGGRLAEKFKDPGEIIAGLKIPGGATRSIDFPINTFFDMKRDSDYEIYAQIGHQRLNYDFRSNRIGIEVRTGTLVWEREFGLPNLDSKSEIATRIMKLLRFQDKDVQVYCLRVEDNDYVYAVKRIARHITGAVPSAEIDAMGNIHVLLRIKARLFLYHIYGHDGDLKQDRLLTFDDTPPSLTRDNDLGRVTVTGGKTAVHGIDYVFPGEAAPPLPNGLMPVLDPL